MARNLEGKIALITGGGPGLGAAICRTLDEAGAVAISVDLRKEAADEVARSRRSAGRRAMALALDVRSERAGKWGLLGFSHALHVEARAQNIKVTAVLSGEMRTPFLLDRFPDLDPAVLQAPKNVAETVRHVLEQTDESVIPEVMVIPIRETSWP